MLSTLGTKIAHQCEKGDLRSAFALAFLPNEWRRRACIEGDHHHVVFMYSGDWFCYYCGTYDDPM